jgi:hypothetical protein
MALMTTMPLSISRPMSTDRSSAWPVTAKETKPPVTPEEDHQVHQQQVDQADAHEHGIGHGDDAGGHLRADAGLANRHVLAGPGLAERRDGLGHVAGHGRRWWRNC